mgnify:CR=1 FL=1
MTHKEGKGIITPFPLFKEKNLKKHILILFFTLVFITNMMADTLSLSFSQNATDNLFQNLYEESDHLSTLGIYIDKNFSGFWLFTEGNYSYLYENTNLSYYTQGIGVNTLYTVNEKSAFYFSLAGRGSFYQSDYSDFNYLSINFFAAFKTYLSQSSILKSNYILEYKNFKSSVFDHTSHSLMLSLDKYFQTKTTLKGEISWGYKNFLHPYISEEPMVMETNPSSSGGKDRLNPYRGRLNQFIMQTQGQAQALQVISLSGLIAQGLGSRLGLQLTGTRQWSLSGKNPFTYIEEFYTVENPSYDRFSWEGFRIGAQLAVLIPWNIQGKLRYTMDNKKFPGIYSLSLEGDPLGTLRNDERRQFEVSIEKNFSKFSVSLSYFYADNDSNDPLFNWSGHFFSAGIQWNTSYGERK